jgi:hypothetical protein
VTVFLTVYGAFISMLAALVSIGCALFTRVLTNDLIAENNRRLERRVKMDAIRNRARRVRGDKR